MTWPSTRLPKLTTTVGISRLPTTWKTTGTTRPSTGRCRLERQLNHNLHEALEVLDDRSRDILYQRWLAEEKATLHDLAQKYNVSAERIRMSSSRRAR
jgi:DNA-directed RNA polymerase sigma subunit (sigma70/sigma32)